jgi:hypothetical protein
MPEVTPEEKDELHTFRLQNLFDRRYAKVDEVRIIRALVFGFVGLILTAVVVTGLVTLVHLNPTL